MNTLAGLLAAAVIGCEEPSVRQAPTPLEPVPPDTLPLRVWEWSEWSLENPTWDGDPYDLVAEVTFTHETSGETRSTGMFFDGDGVWRFRFTPTLPGRWSYRSSSADPELDGREGAFTAEAAAGGRGFVTAEGQHWIWSGTERPFIPQYVMYADPDRFWNDSAVVDRDLELFLGQHGFTGLNVMVLCRWFDLADRACDADDTEIDRRTFEALELLITKAYQAGGAVHLWAWGDAERGWTPRSLPGGLNGEVDRRLQRYIAARLGPLPGWTMQYGFDLWEWVTGPELDEWHRFMNDNMGWPHLLGARASKNELDQLSEAMDYSSYEQHRPSYDTYVQTLVTRPAKPAFSEDRFRIFEELGDKHYDMEMTRRGLWRSAMAGGVANIWGNLIGPYDEDTGSAAYPRPDWIKTNAVFFENRFRTDLLRCNERTDGVCLGRPDLLGFLFYKEDATSVRIDLSGAPAPLDAIAIDALKPYEEIQIGPLPNAPYVWTAPYPSDWAIAAGSFDGQGGGR